MTEKRKWMLEAVRYFRGIGFFEDYKTLSDEELLVELDNKLQRSLKDFAPEDRVTLEELIAMDDQESDDGVPDLSLA